MSFFSKLFQSKKYRKNPNPKILSAKKCTALSIGAIIAEQNSCYYDSLETGLKLGEIKIKLADYFDIVDRESAVEILDWLKERGHRLSFDAIKAFLAGLSPSLDERDLNDEEKEKNYYFIKNLQSSGEDLIKYGQLSSMNELNNVSILSWDMGRLILLSRFCYDANYIDEDEAWAYILDAYEKSRSQYLNWEELSRSYIIGRAMAGGEGVMLNGIIYIAKELLKDKNSPWLLYLLQN
ncbi:DUF1266 domain-containing protein [Streptococcus zalophi]|uniref:DUF1266 domain-containing protein n=1 Tax=Streptococcus zalophi TaxID=640031 RepID=A0A934P9N5_9STRE|nr:DUF1266 domain-containing protein [Streptococcus zalophi]MBJ8349491.1 DUF1266 domain-containing protein [Streptococcus zalophi]